MAIYAYGPQDSVVYTLTAPDGSVAVFNDPDDANYVGFAKFTGLDDAEVRESIEDRASGHGAIQGMNWRGRRPITANIEIAPTSTVDRNEKWALLRRAVNALHDNGTLSWTPDGGLPVQIGVRKNSPLRRAEGSAGMFVAVQMSLMAAEPNVVSQTLHTDSGTSGIETITNQGDGEASPLMTVTGPAANQVWIQNLTTEESLIIPLFTPSTYLADYSSDFKSHGTNGYGSGTWVDKSDNVFVCGGTPGAHTVTKYNSAGTLQWTAGSTAGSADGQFNNPTGVCTDDGGSVYVCDTFNSRVQRLTSAGAYSAKVSVSAFPTQITCNMGTSDVYVAGLGAWNTTEIKRLNGGTMGVTSTFGTEGTSDSAAEFMAISGMVCLSNNDLVVADSTLHKLKRLSQSGTWEATTGGLGTGASQFNGPHGLGRDSGDELYVNDAGNNRVQRFTGPWTTTGATSTMTFEASMGGTDGNYDLGTAQDLTPATLVLYLEGPSKIKKYVAATSRIATLDFEKRTITIAGNNAYDVLDPITSDWWTLAPGDNEIQVYGATSWTIEWRDAWL